MEDDKQMTPVPEAELPEPVVRKTYMCGYVVYQDSTVMLHARNIQSKKIDYYAKISKFVGSKEPIQIHNLMSEIVALAICDYAPKVCKSTGSDTDTASNVAVVTYPDEFGKIHILLVDNDQAKVTNLINKIMNQYHITADDITARVLGRLYNLDVKSFPKMADFASVVQNTDVSKSLQDYYIHNESIQCDLI